MRLGPATLVVALLAGCGVIVDISPDPLVPDRDAGSGGDGDADADADADGDADADADADAGVRECRDDGDCADALGPAPCGEWRCRRNGSCDVRCEGCTDEDADGFGPEPECAGPDCDDADDAVTTDASRPCYGGPDGTRGQGPCADGVESCAAGLWSGVCEGEVVPAAEQCDGEDDDCDGVVDDGGADCGDLFGPAPCGTWECNAAACEVACPGCSDADRDGYGPEVACAGPDCDDDDDAVADTAQTTCYGGPDGTSAVGACRAGVATCLAGTWSPCIGEVLPGGEGCNDQDDDCDGEVDEELGSFSCGLGACETSVGACDPGGILGQCRPLAAAIGDATCDGVDDDCDGAVDEGCVTGCIAVSRQGNDATGDGSEAAPFLTIGAAIAAAAPGDYVCVAAGALCGATARYPEAVVVADGVSVYGGYESTGSWSRCGSSTTILEPGVAEGVLFPAAVQSMTVLDGFRIDRASDATTAGVTVDGATGVVLSNIKIEEINDGSVETAIGVDLRAGAEAVITRSSIWGGNGSIESIGVRSVGSRPTIRDNCLSLNSGRCDDDCGWYGSTNPGIRGRYAAGGERTWAVLLDSSPGAVIEQSALCGSVGTAGAGVRVVGDATGLVLRANYVIGWGGSDDSHGVWLEDCAGAAPWIVDNAQLVGEGSSVNARVDGVRAIGDCHPVVDSNLVIAGGSEGGTAATSGVYCGANLSGSSQCDVLGNLSVQGSLWGHPPIAVGVRCDDDACNRVAGNVITGRGGVDTVGLWLERSGTVVEDNVITGGCGLATTTGVYSNDSFARLVNNVIVGGDCATPVNRGLHVLVEGGGFEVDVHSNTIAGGGGDDQCASIGVELDAAVGGGGASAGVFRNDILRSGDCLGERYDFLEANAAADPRVFENNDLDPYRRPTALYWDEGAVALDDPALVDALGDMTAGANFSVDPSFVGWPWDLHLQAGSACEAAGTAVGAPATDLDGDARDPAAPDVGADEI